MMELPSEVWVLRLPDGGLVAPIDDDGTLVFMAWPSKEEAEQGRAHQIDGGYFDSDSGLTVVQLK